MEGIREIAKQFAIGLGIAVLRSALHGEPYLDQVAAGGPADKAGLKRGEWPNL